MKQVLILSLLFILVNCSKPKTVLICGDHICVNKKEAEQFFEKNLSIEIKVIDKKVSKEIDLIELNMKELSNKKKEISLTSKKNTKKKLKKLSSTEISQIKKEIKEKSKNKIVKINEDKNKRLKVNKVNSKDVNNSTKDKKLVRKNNNIRNKIVNKKIENNVDVCTILEKCSIDEISKYLIKQGKNKNFPNITGQ